jgi:NitT/TauT family transport system ATP-binding protein
MAPDGVKIDVRGLEKWFPTGRGRTVRAIDRVDLAIRDREFLVIVGPSGCGKSTLLRILAGLERHRGGEVVIRHDDPATPLSSMVFQEASAFPWMTVRENIAYPLMLRGTAPARRREIVDAYIGKIGLRGFEDAFPHQLSGGMRQRVSVARAFANDPEILFMDEPFASLDEQTKLVLQEELLRIWEEDHKTVVYVTHSVDEAVTLGDRVAVMTARPGRIKAIEPVPFPRPRRVLDLRGTLEYGRVTRRIWDLLGEEVQRARERPGGVT